MLRFLIPRRLCSYIKHASLSTSTLIAEANAATVPPAPGTVNEYSNHVFIRGIWRPSDISASCPWPPIVERLPVFLQAFAAIAKLRREDEELGMVKVTAFEDEAGRALDPDSCDLLLYPDAVRYNNVHVDLLPPILAAHLSGRGSEEQLQKLDKLQQELTGLQLFVCCHGSRDARCGAIGPSLVSSLCMAAKKLNVSGQVKVYHCSHVGGHKYAGNVLVYGALSPCDGDWFGGLTADNARKFLKALVFSKMDGYGGCGDSVLRKWWRGRMAMAKDEQRQCFENPRSFFEDVNADEAGDVWLMDDHHDLPILLRRGGGMDNEEEDEEEDDNGEESEGEDDEDEDEMERRMIMEKKVKMKTR